jgi:hypothetical protein
VTETIKRIRERVAEATRLRQEADFAMRRARQIADEQLVSEDRTPSLCYYVLQGLPCEKSSIGVHVYPERGRPRCVYCEERLRANIPAHEVRQGG